MNFRKHAAAMKVSVKKNPKDAARVIFVGTGAALFGAMSAHSWIADSIFAWADQSAGVLAGGSEIAILAAGTGFAVYSVKSGKLEKFLDWIDGDEYDEPAEPEDDHRNDEPEVTVGETTEVRPTIGLTSTPDSRDQVVKLLPTSPAVSEYDEYEKLMVAMRGATHWYIPCTSGSGKTVMVHDFLSRDLGRGARYFALDAKPEGDSSLKWPGAIRTVSNPDHFRGALQQVYNLMVSRQKNSGKRYPPLYVVIDEFADVNDADPNLIGDIIIRLLQKARSANIRLILMTQSPSAEFNGLAGYTDLLNRLTVTTQWSEQVDGVRKFFISHARISANGQVSKIHKPMRIPPLPAPWMDVDLPYHDDLLEIAKMYNKQESRHSSPPATIAPVVNNPSRVRTRSHDGDKRGDAFSSTHGFQSSENPAFRGDKRGAAQEVTVCENCTGIAPPYYDGAYPVETSGYQSSVLPYFSGAEVYQNGGAAAPSAPPPRATERMTDTDTDAATGNNSTIATVADVAIKMAQIATQTTGTELDNRDLAEVAAVGSAVMRLVGGGDGSPSLRSVQELAFGGYNSRKNGALSEIIEFLGVGVGE